LLKHQEQSPALTNTAWVEGIAETVERLLAFGVDWIRP